MDMLTRRAALGLVTSAGVAATLAGCDHDTPSPELDDTATNTRSLRILATSDLHGMFVPWDYALDAENPAGSLAQLASAIRELRDENTLLVDAGDTIQGNMSELFLADEVHPMIACLNTLGYDIGVTGNHEYNYGMDITRKTVATFAGTVLTGNVIDENGDPIADGYAIIERNDVRIGLIGMVTPNIVHWDAVNLAGCTVSDPVEESRKIIDQIADDVDVLVGVIHMGLENEYDIKHTGVRDLAAACPEFDVIVASHAHLLIEGEEVNGVLVVENEYHGQTMSVIDLTLERDGDGWHVMQRDSFSVGAADYEPDPDIVELMAPYDERAKSYAHEVVGTLEGGPLAPPNEIACIPQAVLEDTALIDLIQRVQLYYSNADVSAASLLSPASNAEPGPIRRCDASRVYPFNNTLYTIEMSGAQLRTYMEWSAGYYLQYHPGNLTIGFDPDMRLFLYDMFAGVSYKIDVAQEIGSRITELSWPDGTPVSDDDTLLLTTNNYRVNTQLLSPDVIFSVDDLPKLHGKDVAGNIGGIRELIVHYIESVCGGTIESTVDLNWSIIGNDWDKELHEQAVELIAQGLLSVEPEDPRCLTDVIITEDDVRALESPSDAA